MLQSIPKLRQHTCNFKNKTLDKAINESVSKNNNYDEVNDIHGKQSTVFLNETKAFFEDCNAKLYLCLWCKIIETRN